MQAVPLDLHVALLGNPNCGKTALFNLLTGSRQKVANYAGVTVERKEGLCARAVGPRVRVLDLPGAYSLNPLSARRSDHARRGAPARAPTCGAPDAAGLRGRRHQPALNLRLVLEVKRLGLPMVRGAEHDATSRDEARHRRSTSPRWSSELGMPVVETVAVQPRRRQGAGRRDWTAHVPHRSHACASWHGARRWTTCCRRSSEVRRILRAAVHEPQRRHARLDDAHRSRGAAPGVRACRSWRVLLFLMFQAVFSWAAVADGRDQGRHGRRSARCCTARHARRACCAACWSTA